MPNIKSAKKRVLVTKKSTVLNNDVKASMKTAIKKVEKAINKEEAMAKLPEAIKKNRYRRLLKVLLKLILEIDIRQD
ncbi:MAG: 30S ribosomal protein S20 [Clostridium sp.]|nr:MAG: 30S ribosomal protein S20 [Clostridium sp.]